MKPIEMMSFILITIVIINIFNSNTETLNPRTHRIVKKTPEEIAVDAEIDYASPDDKLDLVNYENYELLDEVHKSMVRIRNHPFGAGYESYYRTTKKGETELTENVNQKTHRIAKKTVQQMKLDIEIEYAEPGTYLSLCDKTYNELDDDHKKMVYRGRDGSAHLQLENYYKR